MVRSLVLNKSKPGLFVKGIALTHFPSFSLLAGRHFQGKEIEEPFSTFSFSPTSMGQYTRDATNPVFLNHSHIMNILLSQTNITETQFANP